MIMQPDFSQLLTTICISISAYMLMHLWATKMLIIKTTVGMPVALIISIFSRQGNFIHTTLFIHEAGTKCFA